LSVVFSLCGAKNDRQKKKSTIFVSDIPSDAG
jgi:hypothetical protein